MSSTVLGTEDISENNSQMKILVWSSHSNGEGQLMTDNENKHKLQSMLEDSKCYGKIYISMYKGRRIERIWEYLLGGGSTN